jgi:hypothetical protein
MFHASSMQRPWKSMYAIALHEFDRSEKCFFYFSVYPTKLRSPLVHPTSSSRMLPTCLPRAQGHVARDSYPGHGASASHSIGRRQRSYLFHFLDREHAEDRRAGRL